jgi:integrase
MESQEINLNNFKTKSFDLEKTTTKMNLSEVFAEKRGPYLNQFTLFIAHFNSIPNLIHLIMIDCKEANNWFSKKYKTLIIDCYYNKMSFNSNNTPEFDEIFYFLFDDLIVNFDITCSYVRFFFKKTEISNVEEIITQINRFKEKKKGPKISLLISKGDKISTKSFEISKPKLSINNNYNDDFKEIHQTILKRLSKKGDKGLVLLHGKPGTGKTSYVRFLITSLKKDVIFLPPNMATAITNPDLISILIDNPNTIFVIEDAENIIVDREKNGSSPVSTLLNISDGLLSDCLNIQIICSFNTDISKVDSALMRKGRLIAKYEFKELEVEKAQALSNKLGFNSNINSPMTLTDIYNQKEKDFQQSKKINSIGFPTGITISNARYKSSRFSDWDYSRNLVKSNVSGYEEMNERITTLVDKANTFLNANFKKHITLEPSELETLLKSNEIVTIASSTSKILELYKQFHSSKKEQFIASGSIASLKDFTSTFNLLRDFETYTGRSYQIYPLDMIWCRDMLNFMRLPHKDEPLENKFYITDGALAGKASKKRFDIFVQFAEYLKILKITKQELIDELKSFRKKEIKVPKTEKTTLTIEEVFSFYDFKFDSEKLDMIRDTFVFICLTGLRYSDYLRVERAFIKKSTKSDDLIYVRKAIKTKGSSGLNYKIPICNIAIDILKRYNYQLPNLPKPNGIIKEALKLTGLFNDPTQQIDKKTGQEKLRYQCISMHKGRDTFITNLVDSTPLNQLMKYTGHSKLSTLQTYIDGSREVDTNPIKIFNRN